MPPGGPDDDEEFEELLAEVGLYATLWRVQVGDVDALPGSSSNAPAGNHPSGDDWTEQSGESCRREPGRCLSFPSPENP